MSDLPNVEVFTNGSCMKKPGPGGYAAMLKYGEHEKEVAGGFRLTTIGRMDLMGVIAGLQLLKTSCHVSVYSGSLYLVDSMVKRLPNTWRTLDRPERDAPRARPPVSWSARDRRPAQRIGTQ